MDTLYCGHNPEILRRYLKDQTVVKNAPKAGSALTSSKGAGAVALASSR